MFYKTHFDYKTDTRMEEAKLIAGRPMKRWLWWFRWEMIESSTKAVVIKTENGSVQ